MMRENDLRALLEDDAAAAPDHPVPRAAIARQATAIRRRRYTAGAALAVIGVAVAMAVPSLTVRNRTPQPAGPTIRIVDGLPEYLSGGRLDYHAVFRGPATNPAPVSFTVPSYDVFIATTCTGHASYRVVIGGAARITGNGGCGGVTALSWQSWMRRDSVHALGIGPGRSTTMSVEFAVRPAAGDTVTFGVYRLLPPGQYPLPPRPANVPPVTGPIPVAVRPIATVTAQPADPDAAVSRQVTLTARLGTVLTCAAPGAVEVFAGGHLIHEAACWDYHQTSSDGGTIIEALRVQGITARPGQRMTLTVRPSRFLDPAWQVDIGPVD
jgi:hypothetical protein